MYRRLVALLMLMSLVLVACAAPAPDSDAAGPTPIATAAAPAGAQGTPTPPEVPAPIRQRTKPAPPMSDPLPAERVPDVQPSPRPPSGSVRAPGATGKVDSSCRTDADCTVKNVGNCCGAYPACVNVDSPTDPEGVRAQCAKSGMASVCGFAEISGCQCVQGQCQASNSAVAH